MAKQTVMVNTFTNGILDPEKDMLGPVKDGGRIIVNTAPGCWGPMITPEIRGGHEVCQPIYVEGAEPGDAIVIRIESISVTSMATASGNDKTMEGRFLGDPFIAGKCPSCGELYPKTVIKDIGKEAIRCAKCGADTVPFTFTNGYTIVFDDKKRIGVTVEKNAAEKIAHNGREYMQIPDNSIQNPVVTLAPSDIPGIATRLRPFVGQLGTTPKRPIPDSHNAGDFGSFLIDAPHEYAQTTVTLEDKTDGHMDVNKVREGAVLICPVKVPGGGVYVGDVHAMQGEGEIAGHTADVAAVVTLQVFVIHDLTIDGPILLPVIEDVPYLAKPLTEAEKDLALKEAKRWGMADIEQSAPLSFIGTGQNLNIAIDNGLKRAADLLEVSVPEV
ncbi:acetamidase/formamidase family protein [Clostridium polynesiense]|uniref:acetamidase/formamidase family protein n=1 Tax=Clostridium polynesiense TaxID=1325933 RepID=UPI000A9FDCCB|nr:acetamidase/formamidase family protein [Clostridium polynesiense]